MTDFSSPAHQARRSALMSFMNTFAAPPMVASRACISPMGPEPITSTVSPGPMAQRWNALYTHESGSTTAAAGEVDARGHLAEVALPDRGRGHEQALGEAAVDVDAEGLEGVAELGVAAHAPVAHAAAHVRGHGHAHALAVARRPPGRPSRPRPRSRARARGGARRSRSCGRCGTCGCRCRRSPTPSPPGAPRPRGPREGARPRRAGLPSRAVSPPACVAITPLLPP